MNVSLSVVLGYIVLPLFTIFILPLIKNKFDDLGARMKAVEEQMREIITEPQVRQLIQDKYQPLDENIKRIDSKLDYITTLLLENKKDG